MNGRAFLEVARELVAGATEAHWRAAVGRAYYALMLEGREVLLRWGFACPPRHNVHTWVRLRLSFATHPDLKAIGYDLDVLCQARNRADYDLSAAAFMTAPKAVSYVHMATAALALLDQIDADPVRRAAAVASIRP